MWLVYTSLFSKCSTQNMLRLRWVELNVALDGPAGSRHYSIPSSITTTVHLLAALWRLSKSEHVIAKRSSWTRFSSFLMQGHWTMYLMLSIWKWSKLGVEETVADFQALGSDRVRCSAAREEWKSNRSRLLLSSFISDIPQLIKLIFHSVMILI